MNGGGHLGTSSMGNPLKIAHADDVQMAQLPRAAADSDSDSSADSTITVLQYLLLMASTVASVASIASMAWISDDDDDDDDGIVSKRQLQAISDPASDPLLKTELSRAEWQALCEVVVPVIDGTSKSTGAQKRKRGRPPKLSAASRLLNCILFLKKDESMSKSSAAEDCIYICDLICQALGGEIAWPDSSRRSLLARQSLPGCIGFVDDIVVHIPRPLIGPEEFHSPSYNGYVMLSAIAIDHDGFIMLADPARPGSMERSAPEYLQSDLEKNFAFDDEKPAEYLIGNYDGAEKDGVLRSLPDGAENLSPVLEAFRSKQSGHRVSADWGISGLLSQWGILSKPFTARRDKFNTILRACCILTNFLHRRRHNLRFQDRDGDGIGAWIGCDI